MTSFNLKVTMKNKKVIGFTTSSFSVAREITAHHAKGGIFFSCWDGVGMSIDYKNILAVQFEPAQETAAIAPVAQPKDNDKPAIQPEIDNNDDDHFEALAQEISTAAPKAEKKKKHHVSYNPDNDKNVIDPITEAALAREMLEAAGEPIDQIKTKAVYKIECRCGAEYFCALYTDSVRARCRECGEKVFYDKNTEKVIDGNGNPAGVMTNRYFVEQEL
ncbi:hypothetical protein [Pectinatus frisingensis]|uniref:hypothetical protein n=1 Tax=Pectinatus frisingensis TaxID=865 RepID=UPI0018C501CB|nr:hypothetical protein [Pectinatus frisingensis]